MSQVAVAATYRLDSLGPDFTGGNASRDFGTALTLEEARTQLIPTDALERQKWRHMRD